MDDLSPSKICADEVHKIAILDIRIMNADRNTANLLCRRREDNSLELVPIDHGYSLRSIADVSWMDWPQLKEVNIVKQRFLATSSMCFRVQSLTVTMCLLLQPLSEKSKNYVLKLDIDADINILKEKLNICQEAVDYFRSSSKLLQEGVKAGLTLYDIAIMCCRNDDLGEIP
jgi:hypothetical protein